MLSTQGNKEPQTFQDDLERLGIRSFTFTLENETGDRMVMEAYDYKIISGTLRTGEPLSLVNILVSPEGLLKTVQEYFTTINRKDKMEFIRKLGEVQ